MELSQEYIMRVQRDALSIIRRTERDRLKVSAGQTYRGRVVNHGWRVLIGSNGSTPTATLSTRYSFTADPDRIRYFNSALA